MSVIEVGAIASPAPTSILRASKPRIRQTYKLLSKSTSSGGRQAVMVVQHILLPWIITPLELPSPMRWLIIQPQALELLLLELPLCIMLLPLLLLCGSCAVGRLWVLCSGQVVGPVQWAGGGD
jgi:hypothetical protein